MCVDTAHAMTSMQIRKTAEWLRFRGIAKSKIRSVNSYGNSWGQKNLIAEPRFCKSTPALCHIGPAIDGVQRIDPGDAGSSSGIGCDASSPRV